MDARVSITPLGRTVQALVPPAAAVLGVLTLVVVPVADLEHTTHAGASSAAAIANATAGLGLVAAGLIVWLLGPGSGSGQLVLTLAGLSWFASTWVGWEGGPPVARSVAMVVEPFFLAFVFHAVLAALADRLGSKRVHAAVGAGYATAGIISVGRALFRDPFLDPYCWSNCRVNVFLLEGHQGVARALDGAWTAFSLAAGSALVIIAIYGLASATSTARRRLWPILVPTLLLAAATAAYAVALARLRPENPSEAVFSALFQIRGWAAAGLAAGFAMVVIRRWRARVALARLASQFSEAPVPGSLGQMLARGTGDSSLEVLYPLPGSDRYVDASGSTADLPAAGSARVITPITRGGMEIALVVHDAAIVDAEQLRTEIGPAARLAIDNERLQAEVLAQLEDLRASRVRLVETGDAERRRLERNLHDGAQQRLLALSYDLRLALSAAKAGGGSELRTLLAAAEREARQAITDLRELAQGIYPAVLTESGIGPALWTLSDSAPLPVEIGDVPDQRFSEAVERTAFVVVAEGVDAADRHGSSHAGVRVLRDDDRLVVEIEGAGPGPFVHAADRVGALGGRLIVHPGLLRAEIPCG